MNRVVPAAGAASAWAAWLPAMAHATKRLQVVPERTLVLVPYAQMMDAGRRAWALTHSDGFSPRFESTRNWAQALEPFAPGPSDLSMDMARDSLVAAAFIDRMVSGRTDPALRSVMISRLVEAARQLAPLAAAVAPGQRLDWADGLRTALTLPQQALHWEGMLASLALAWVSTSAFATDVLWGPLGQPGRDADALLVLPGFQPDPLVKALVGYWGDRALVLEVAPDLAAPQPMPDVGLHLCADPEDEAQRSAACVIAQLDLGRSPVVLVANDRMLTRRVSTMLHGAGLAVRDETGWKLSTSHAAAQFMGLLRASKRLASMDDVLEWLKHSPAWSEVEVTTLERWAREQGVATWQAALQPREPAPVLPTGLTSLLDGLQAPRPLVAWLADLTKALQRGGLWTGWQADLAGQQLIQVLRLGEGAAWDLDMVGQSLASDTASVAAQMSAPRPGARLSQAAFTGWVRDVLEGASFMPRSAGDADVVILPMPQLLGREFGAVVVPGCDESHLNPSPEPPGHWTAAQRDLLGLPSREVLAAAAAQAWQTTLGQPHLDVLWRAQERGEAVLPSPWVQALAGLKAQAADPRAVRHLATQVAPRPSPSAGDLLPESLSASSYQDLRDCPYRYFSLRQLKLSEVQELEDEPDARDMGNWLHLVLRCFHEQRGDSRPGRAADEEALDQLAESTAATMGLNGGEGGAGFLPYQAVWPRLRDGYLDWLEGFEARGSQPGPRFERAEAAMNAHAGDWKLFGKLDRIDQQDSPEGRIPFVIDYKTENRQKTQDRVKQPLEDTQLAFYAALLPEDNLRAAYLSITDKRGDAPKDAPTLLVEQVDVLLAREHLRAGLAHDMARIAKGAPMPALGEGSVCDFCAARGLCRKDHWAR